MASDKSSTDIIDVYDWICHLQSTVGKGSPESIQQSYARVHGKILSLEARSNGKGEVCLFLWCDSLCLGELGTASMEQNLLPLFSNLCIYAFLKLTHRSIVDLQLRRLDIGSGTIESAKYKEAFNSLFSAASYSHLIHGSKQLSFEDDKSEDLLTELQELAAQRTKETLTIIGAAATDCLMKSLATKFTEIRLGEGGMVDPFQMSYSSSGWRDWSISFYCPRLPMTSTNTDKKNKDTNLEDALSHQLLHCTVVFGHKVNLRSDLIEVEPKIENVRCRAFRFDSCKPIKDKLKEEWYFPARISLTVEPQSSKSDVRRLSLGASSQNPSLSVANAKTCKIGLQSGI